MRQKVAAHYAILVSFLLLAACTPSIPLPTSAVPAVMPKLLATVYISPTPDAQQQEATRAASPPTVTEPSNIAPSATPYVGVFLGEVQSAEDGGPVINPALVNNAPTPFDQATLVPACPAQADVIFGTRWQGDATASGALGCPIELAGSVKGKAQVFERGVMYGSPDGAVWAIVPGEGHYWYYPLPLPVPQGDAPPPPAGLFPASAAFTVVWRSVQGLSDSIGYGRTAEQADSITTQRFQGGVLLADSGSGQVFVLLADGRAFGPY